MIFSTRFSITVTDIELEAVALLRGSVYFTSTVELPLRAITALPSLSAVIFCSAPLTVAVIGALAIALPSRSFTVTVTELPSSVSRPMVAFATGAGTSTGTSISLMDSTSFTLADTLAPLASVYESSTVAFPSTGIVIRPFSSAVIFCSLPLIIAATVAFAIGAPSKSLTVTIIAPSPVTTSRVALAITGTSTGTISVLLFSMYSIEALASAPFSSMQDTTIVELAVISMVQIPFLSVFASSIVAPLMVTSSALSGNGVPSRSVTVAVTLPSSMDSPIVMFAATGSGTGTSFDFMMINVFSSMSS